MQRNAFALLLLVSLTATTLAGCVGGGGDPEIYGTATGGTIEEGTIKQAGSSTVYPIAERWAEDFGFARADVHVEVGGGGSGAGASGVCNGELDIGDMSRSLKQSEIDGECADNGVTPLVWKVAFDGLSVVVSNKNTFVEDLSVQQLHDIFVGDDHVTHWNQVDADFPDAPIKLCYPDSDSGTYEYFGEAVLHEAEPRRGDGVQTSSDDNVLVQCLANEQYAIGYFGFAYVLQNEDLVRPIKVDGTAPSFETIADGSYTPLSRPLFMVTDGVPTGLLADYFRYAYHPEGGQSLVEDVGYVALDENTRLEMIAQLE